MTVKTWVGENPALTAAIVKTAGGLAMLLAVGGGLTVMLASFMGPFAMVRYGLTLIGIKSLGAVTAIKSVGSVLLWVGRALMLNPIGLAITALAAAALIYENWGAHRSLLSEPMGACQRRSYRTLERNQGRLLWWN